MSLHVGAQRATFWPLSVVIALTALFLTAYRIDEPPWERGHHSFHMGEYPRNAVNYLRYGYLRTGFGRLENLGEDTGQPLVYCTDRFDFVRLARYNV